jgi:mRNA-degrading endonuclease toxin of MazEF toxin-antitoxin module
MRLRAGQIVIVDWRDALPREPNKLLPAVVVHDAELFEDALVAILVPLTEDAALAVQDLSVSIEPTAANGCTKRCHALAHHVAATSTRRIRPTGRHITPTQLKAIRERIALAIGLA